MGTLTGKVVLVTGGSRGIGAAIAKRLASDGAAVAITYSKSPEKANALVKELEHLGVKAMAFQADQSNVSQSKSMVEAVAKQFGRIDIFVANAGVYEGGAIDDETVDVAKLKRLYETNVIGVADTVRAVVKHMGEGGRIILIGSVNGEQTPFSGQADYSATKAALLGYARGWARDLGRKNITVNTIQPGPIDTDMNPDNSDFAKALKPLLAIPRYGRPEEVAYAVSFLASPEASYITGSALTVDGGMNA